MESVLELYHDIDGCITDLVNSRLHHNEEMERKTIAQMESLMVQCQQELDVVADYLEEH